MTTPGRYYIDDLASHLGRAPHTIRQWVKRPDFPDDLKPAAEGGRNKLFWTDGQLPGLERYADERESLRGSFGRVAT